MDPLILFFFVPPLIAVAAAGEVTRAVTRRLLRYSGLYFLTVFTVLWVLSKICGGRSAPGLCRNIPEGGMEMLNVFFVINTVAYMATAILLVVLVVVSEIRNRFRGS
ncbi:MAG: hypothetical protein AAGE61_19470 [Pseudomonadota bacterium]